MSSQSSSYSSSPSDLDSSSASYLSTTPQDQEFLLYPPVVLVSSRAVVDDAITAATLVCCRIRGIIISIFREVLPRSAFPRGTLYVDHSPHILLPGLVDAHVHLNEPGRTEWEGFWTGTRAAAFGGVTTVIDMPLNAIPPTTSVDAFEEKIRAATGKCWVDVGFYGGVVPENAGTGELSRLVRRGVKGFKGFLIDSGVEEFPAVTPTHIEAAMKELSTEPTTLMFHAEMDHPNHQAAQATTPENPHLYQTFLDSRPPSYETHAIQTIVDLAHTAPHLPLHIVHLSAVEAIPILQRARAEGINITTETCFHYLSIAAEEIQEGDARHKCCPPIRSQSNQDGLWKELLKQCHGEDSIIKTVVSDHSPCTPNLKLLPPDLGGDTQNEKGNFLTAWGGVSSVGLGLPILWTEQKSRGFSIVDLVRWCCINTAMQVGLGNKKGSLAVGMDADIAVFDDEAEFTVQSDTMLFRNKSSPYEGRKLTGMVRETWLRSKRIYTRSHGFVEKSGPLGSLLLEPRKHNEHMTRIDSHDSL